MKLALVKSDVVGALASTLCLIHCLITPIIFIAHTCSITCCAESPVWWKTLDYVFLTISFFAVAYSVKNSTGNIIKPLL